MRILIIDPLLKNQCGHCFFYTKAVQTELQKRNIPTYIFGNLEADKICLTLQNFYPSFTGIIDKAFNAGFWKLLTLYKDIQVLKKQFSKVFLTDFKIEKDDIFFCHTLYVFELLSFALFLKKNKKIVVTNKNKIVIFLRFAFIRKSIFLTLFFITMYKIICNFILKGLNSQITYVTDSDLLKIAYEKLINKKLVVFPIPVYPIYSSRVSSKFDIRNENKTIISSVGGTRYNKGFDLFVKMIDNLIKDPFFSDRTFFVVQVDIPSQTKPELNKVLKIIKLLENLRNTNPNIKIVYGTLQQDEYYELMYKSDIIVLPYRQEGFSNATSNILTESVVLGKIPVGSSGTWIGHELLKYNLEDLIFKNGDLQDLIKVVKNVVLNYSQYKDKIKPIQTEYIKFHNSKNLVDKLLK